jgi:hypothetical protein
MKVFVSSTCYDLVDLRTELYEDIRDLGVECIFSDFIDSGFKVPKDAKTNSIEACLVNLRDVDIVIVILSQRYGPSLGPAFKNLSATHCEYEEARRLNKNMLFYVRDSLVGDWNSWKRNGRKKKFEPLWAAKDDAAALFNFMDQLYATDGTPGANNWSIPFRTSFDLRKNIRHAIEPAAFKDAAEKLINAGHAPILIVQGQGLPTSNNIYSFEFVLLNVGPIPAVAITPSLIFSDLKLGGSNVDIPAILPGKDGPVNQGARTARFTLSYDDTCAYMARNSIAKEQKFQAQLRLEYSTPSGHIMADTSLAEFKMDHGNALTPTRLPLYQRKEIVGMRKPIS